MTRTHVALIGASGFLGGRVLAELLHRGAWVDAIVAPRLASAARDPQSVHAEVARFDNRTLRESLAGADVIVNAAGLADASGSRLNVLFGANALLPATLAAAKHSHQRLVHVSSAAVQGRMRLDDDRRYAPFSPYSTSKVVGEQALVGASHTVTFRPTSVHGPDRAVTQSLYRFLQSPLSSVAGVGNGHTPQTLVENVAAALAEIAMMTPEPPTVVLQPSEGLTCHDLAMLLGGRAPRRLPAAMTRAVILTGLAAGQRSPRVLANTRRAELLWFGQAQATSWLTVQGWVPPAGREGWAQLRQHLAAQAAGTSGELR